MDDLSHWTNEGTAYYRTQDPSNVKPGVHPLYFCAKGAGVLDVRTVVFE